MGSVSAGHVFKDKGYKYEMGNKELNKYKKIAKKDAKKTYKKTGYIVGHAGTEHKVSKIIKSDSLEPMTKKQFNKIKNQREYYKNCKFLGCKKITKYVPPDGKMFPKGGYYTTYKIILKKTVKMELLISYVLGDGYYYDAYC